MKDDITHCYHTASYPTAHAACGTVLSHKWPRRESLFVATVPRRTAASQPVFRLADQPSATCWWLALCRTSHLVPTRTLLKNNLHLRDFCYFAFAPFTTTADGVRVLHAEHRPCLRNIYAHFLFAGFPSFSIIRTSKLELDIHTKF
jgi:hypothetical protein